MELVSRLQDKYSSAIFSSQYTLDETPGYKNLKTLTFDTIHFKIPL